MEKRVKLNEGLLIHRHGRSPFPHKGRLRGEGLGEDYGGEMKSPSVSVIGPSVPPSGTYGAEIST